MSNPAILILSGSVRANSFNTKLAFASQRVLSNLECVPTQISLVDYPLPIYDGDLEAEQGTPKNAKKLARLFHENHGIVFASPEYNGSVTPLLKNTIDWISRVSSDDKGSLTPYKGKFAAMISTSPGQMGGVNSLSHLRPILSRLGMLVISEQVTVGNALSAFSGNNNLSDERAQSFLEKTCISLVNKCSVFNLT